MLIFWGIFENWQLKTLLNSKILPNRYVFVQKYSRNDSYVGTVQYFKTVTYKNIGIYQKVVENLEPI